MTNPVHSNSSSPFNGKYDLSSLSDKKEEKSSSKAEDDLPILTFEKWMEDKLFKDFASACGCQTDAPPPEANPSNITPSNTTSSWWSRLFWDRSPQPPLTDVQELEKTLKKLDTYDLKKKLSKKLFETRSIISTGPEKFDELNGIYKKYVRDKLNDTSRSKLDFIMCSLDRDAFWIRIRTQRTEAPES